MGRPLAPRGGPRGAKVTPPPPGWPTTVSISSVVEQMRMEDECFRGLLEMEKGPAKDQLTDCPFDALLLMQLNGLRLRKMIYEIKLHV